MTGRLLRTALLASLAIVIVGAIAWWSYPDSGNDTGVQGRGIFSLVRPAFAQQGSFLDQEAGFAAWTRVEGTVDLSLAKQRFKTLDSDTSEYLVGEVEVSSSGVTSGPHVYLSRDGWIVAYYFRDQPAASAWHSNAVRPPNNFLLVAVQAISAAAGVSTSSISYYDFRYPSANKITAIYGGNGTEISVPSEIQVAEASISAFKESQWGSLQNPGNITIASDQFLTFKSLPRQFHKQYDGLSVPTTVVLIYRQP